MIGLAILIGGGLFTEPSEKTLGPMTETPVVAMADGDYVTMKSWRNGLIELYRGHRTDPKSIQGILFGLWPLSPSQRAVLLVPYDYFPNDLHEKQGRSR